MGQDRGVIVSSMYPTYFDLIAVAVAGAETLTGPQATQHSPHLTTHGELSE